MICYKTTTNSCSSLGTVKMAHRLYTHLHLIVALHLLVLVVQTSVKLILQLPNGIRHFTLPELPVILVGILANQSLQFLHLLVVKLQRHIM